MKVSKGLFTELVGKSTQNKYHNKKIEYDGITFDSKKEYAYFIKLKLLEQAKEIHDLELQKEFVLIKPFELNGKKYRKTSYYADFVYLDKENKLHVIDVKSEITKKDKVYVIKKKLMAKEYKIEIEEI